MAAVYFCLGWWPFGTGTVLTGDLRGLYVNHITDMWARVKEGGFFYSFGKLAGGKLVIVSTGAASIQQMRELMLALGCVDAFNVDGGASCGMYYNGSYLATPGREIPVTLQVFVD